MRKPVPGMRFFKCDECGYEWKEPSRDCLSPSGEPCQNPDGDECEAQYYGALESPYKVEEHPEWPTSHGNLISGFDYENYKEETC